MITETRAEVGLAQSRSTVGIGTRLIACGLLILIIQCAFWIQQGHWTPCDPREVLDWLGARPPSTAWPLGQTVIDLVLACPFSAPLAAVGSVMTWTGAKGLNHPAESRPM